ncbi:MAG TPA: hypothetical protein VFV05_14975 [Methylomirabilota bacterium]|nr:hypothetical protein [Methylomirabilota bacterium]
MEERWKAPAGDEVPGALRRWFVAHFVVDWVFALPLLVFPDAFLRALGWPVVDPMAARGVAAALVGIGTQSLLSRNAGVAVYREMLSLKILWSATAALGFGWTALTTGPPIGWVFAVIFALFSVLWTYWWRRLGTSGTS